MFAVIFVLIVLSTLAMQFHFTSRQAQMTAHRFQTSEAARQVALAAAEEAFMQIKRQTSDPTSVLFNKLLNRSSDIDASSNLSNRLNYSIAIDLPLLEQQLENMQMGKRFNVEATARIIDFRQTDSQQTGRYYGQEGVGTIEIRTVAQASEEYQVNTPGACIITRHHDYKVITMVSRRRNDEQRTEYAQNYVLDYALLIRYGENELEDSAGTSLNPLQTRLSIDQTAIPPERRGKVFLGNRRPDSYVYINLDRDREDFINARENNSIVTANSDQVFNILPSFRADLEREAEQIVDDQGATLVSFELRGHEAHFRYRRYAVTDDALPTSPNLSEFRDMTAYSKAQHLAHTPRPFSPGIIFEPANEINTFMEGNVRQRFFHYGYFILDISNAEVLIEIEEESGTIREDVTGVDQSLMADDHIPVFNADHFESAGVAGTQFSTFLDLRYIADEFTNDDIPCRMNVDQAYANGTVNQPVFFNFRSPGPVPEANAAGVPYAHVNLWSRRNLSAQHISELGIFDGSTLNLHGIIHMSDFLDLESDSGGSITIEGKGVIIAPGIRISSGITKSSDDDLAVFVTRGDPIFIETTDPIEASLVSMRRTSPYDGRLYVTGKLDLKGALAVDKLNVNQWNPAHEHTIRYDPALKRSDDLYLFNFSRWISYERMLESEDE